MPSADPSAGSIAAQIQALAARHTLPTGAARSLERLVWLLAEDPVAPTTIRDPWRILKEGILFVQKGASDTYTFFLLAIFDWSM